ncbi:HesB/IscA family protein [Buchnera aphidicola]|uniref:HesB/IscA family protein n=1 Tax=Buchnera aphidicola TaxID=9 RepID=UPI0009E57CF1|nr:iron-sulfur cluster assembly accessory protein [Buchnera aphidicola]
MKNIDKQQKRKKTPLIKINITKKAEKQIIFLLKKSKKNIGVQIKIKKTGCAGFKYVLAMAKKIDSSECVLTEKKIKFFIPVQWTSIINNTTIDFLAIGLNSSFTFQNQNHISTCGCGESFNI